LDRACTTGTSIVADAPVPAADVVAPTVVALGGGHGLAQVLRAAQCYAGSITAVVSVADDGGSSGRLRRDLDVPAPGDARKCLEALAGDTTWAAAFAHRFDSGELEGHALGNLVLAGLTETLGDFSAALEAAGRILDTRGRVVPATIDAVVLKADIDGGSVEGQVAVATTAERIRRVEVVPADAAAHPAAVAAILAADHVILAPGSLFTSLLPVVCVRGLGEAVRVTRGQVVQVCNLRAELPETRGLDAAEHLRAVIAHGARVDQFLVERDGPLACDEAAVRAAGAELVLADVTVPPRLVHDPVKLASVLMALL
jgi:uncharacterized cofD-like protein